MGNFTTAFAALNLGRRVCGYEINKNAYDFYLLKLKEIEFGKELSEIKKVNNILPKNQGKKITQEEIDYICQDYVEMIAMHQSKKSINEKLQKKYQRGRFAIKNIIDANLTKFINKDKNE